MDGSSLVAVVSGAVDLQSGGATVPLAADEAVQLQPGQPPGPKFSWIGKQLDFSAWDQGKLQDYLADPVASAQKVEEQLASYRASLNDLLPQLAQQKAAYDAAYAQLKALVDAKDDAKAKEYRDSTVFPLMLNQACYPQYPLLRPHVALAATLRPGRHVYAAQDPPSARERRSSFLGLRRDIFSDPQRLRRKHSPSARRG